MPRALELLPTSTRWAEKIDERPSTNRHKSKTSSIGMNDRRMQEYDLTTTKTDISKVSTRESQEQMMRIANLHNQGAWDDWKANNVASNSKKDDRKRKTTSMYEAQGIDSFVLPGEEEKPGQMGHFAFARGPVRTSYHSRK